MKKVILSAVFSLIIATTAFANDIKVNPVAVQNFKSEFKKASQVKWETFGDFTLAQFMQNGEVVKAYYDEQGELYGTSRQVLQEDLHLSIKRLIARLYSGYTVKEAIEFKSDDGVAHYLIAENEKHTAVLKVINGVVSLHKKEAKKS